MKPNFVQLDLKLNNFIEAELTFNEAVNYTTYWQKYTASLARKKDFYKASITKFPIKDHVESFLNILPKKLLEEEIPETVFNVIDPTKADKHAMLGPHRDRIRQCAINFYLNPIGEETKYYSYAAGELTQVDSFIAKQNECWLINTDIPHSVDLKQNHVRKILSFSFVNTPFEKVVEYFECTNDKKQ
jgi:hypothetical protein